MKRAEFKNFVCEHLTVFNTVRCTGEKKSFSKTLLYLDMELELGHRLKFVININPC